MADFSNNSSGNTVLSSIFQMDQLSLSPNEDAKIVRRIWLTEAYWFFQRSLQRVVQEYRRVFPNDTVPTNAVILRNVKKFHDNGTVSNLNKGHSGRPSSSASADNTARVEEFFAENPRASTRRASQALDIPRSSLQRIIKTKLKLFPFKIQVFQELSDFDMERRLEFARQTIDGILRREIRTKRIWFSDEAHFWLTGYVNKQNYRFWARENPRIFETTSLKPQRITVWCAICQDGIFGPIFIDQNVNGRLYKELLEEKFIPFAKGMKAVDRHWFMQDGALPHRTSDVMEVLDEHFTGRVMGLGYASKFGGGMDWPPYSPDLNPCDFFLWGYLKDKVYAANPRTLEDLKTAITREIAAIDQDTLKNVVLGFESRLHAVVEMEGAHIEHYLH